MGAEVRRLLSGMRGIVRARGDKWYDHIAIVAVYGPHFREKPTISGKVCEQLGKYNINILGISTSISSISCVIKDEDLENAQESLLEVFELPE
jgi:aspartokinase